MSEYISNHVKAFSLERAAIVVDNSALDSIVQHSHEVDVVVDAQAYRDLRASYAWQEERDGEGALFLTQANMRVHTRWGRHEADALRARGYETHGAAFAGLPDIYEYKQESGDHATLTRIRERLYDRPLPVAMIHRELAFIHEVKPSDLPDHTALAVAANGLYIVRTIFGDHTDHIHSYRGSVEVEPVPAAYHEYWHSANGVERIAKHAATVNQGRLAVGRTVLFTPGDIYASMGGFAYHDSRMGDGRESANPAGFDELKAAEMFSRHLTLSGCTDDDLPDKGYAGIRATGFNEETKSQDINPERGHLHIQEAIAANDLGVFAEPTFPLETTRLAVEDLCRHVNDRILTRHAQERDIRITTVAEGLRIIDQSPELLQMLAGKLLESAAFCKNYQYSESWTRDNHSRRVANVAFVKHLARQIASGSLNATQAYAAARAYAGQLRP